MTTTEEYNGWTNRETWAVALHIDNDEAFHTHRYGLVEKVNQTSLSPTHPDPEKRTSKTKLLARKLEAWVQELFTEFYFEGSSRPALRLMFCDIGSLWRVNWDEIAKNFLDE